jgi:hypothetical protein
MEQLPHGTTPVHSSTEAREVAEHAHVGPQRITDVVAAMVTDPTGIKVGLPSTARVMWVIYGEDGYDWEPVDPVGRPASATPGTVTHVLSLVDDETLKLGGNFACEP